VKIALAFGSRRSSVMLFLLRSVNWVGGGAFSSFRRLVDLDCFGAHVREDHGAGRTGQGAGEVHDLHAG
jgi:hypothetical protein